MWTLVLAVAAVVMLFCDLFSRATEANREAWEQERREAAE